MPEPPSSRPRADSVTSDGRQQTASQAMPAARCGKPYPTHRSMYASTLQPTTRSTQLPIWNVRDVSEDPKVELVRWRVFETETGERHFVGLRPSLGTGRVSSAIIDFDPGSRTGTTSSGRRYVLMGPPCFDSDGDYTWALWSLINGVTSSRDVTDEWLAKNCSTGTVSQSQDSGSSNKQ